VHPEDEGLLATLSGDPLVASAGDPAGRARALQYDIALNGWELGGGSVRFHTRAMLSRSFSLQGHSLHQQEAKFSGILEAFEYGAPPHGGIALGIDRWIALLTDQTNIREVMAFPKTSSGSDLMLDAPSPVEPEQLGLGRPDHPGRPPTRRDAPGGSHPRRMRTWSAGGPPCVGAAIRARGTSGSADRPPQRAPTRRRPPTGSGGPGLRRSPGDIGPSAEPG
jgi:hypothetical protein